MNCGFVRVLPPSGRTLESFAAATHWAMNPMNQAHLSKLVLRMFSQFALNSRSAESVFTGVIKQYCSKPTAEILLSNYQRFAEYGLSHLSESEKSALRRQLAESATPVERDLINWLEGRYEVGLDAVALRSKLL